MYRYSNSVRTSIIIIFVDSNRQIFKVHEVIEYGVDGIVMIAMYLRLIKLLVTRFKVYQFRILKLF